MSITVDVVADGERWNDLLAESPQASPFHRYEFLEVCARHGDMDLHPFVGYKGQEPIGLFPLFEVKRGPARAAFSPPPGLRVYYLGPAPLNVEKLKQGKREHRNRKFVQAVLEEANRTFNPRYFNVRPVPAYQDERPFLWEGYDARPRHTYRLDLTADLDDLVMAFNRDVRKAIRSEADGFEVADATLDEIARIIDAAADRHEEKGASYKITPSFVTDLASRLPDDVVHAHVCRIDGEFCGGQVSLEHDGTVYGWQSAGDISRSVPVYDLMYWHAFREAKDRGCETYDMLGANDPDLCTYKAKFAPDLHTHQELTKGSWDMKAALKVYERLH